MMLFAALSDVVWNALIAAVLAIVLKWMDSRSEARTNTVTASLDETKANVQKIELATNSMKDALVEATKTAGELKGANDERARNESEKAMLVQGGLDERTRADAEKKA